MTTCCTPLFTALLILSSFTTLIAQDQLIKSETQATKNDTKNFTLTSLDGKTTHIKVIPDYANHVLKFISANDTIKIIDFWGVPPKSRLLNKSFLQIKYAVRGGSNLGLGNILILCVKNRKLTEAIHVLENINSDGFGYKSNYQVKFNLNGNSANNYKLKADIHDAVTSKEHPEENYSFYNRTILSFDKKLSVFYNIKDYVDNRSSIAKGEKPTHNKVNGNYPAIILENNIYYFVNNKWYNAQAGIDLTEM